MSDIVNLLNMDWRNGLIFIAAIIIVFIWIIDKWSWIVSKFGLQTRASRRETKQDEDIAELKDHAKKTDENFEKILSSVECLQGSIHGLSEQVKALQDKNDMNEAARLKDRISQGYRYYSEKGKWTKMEKEAMEEMIRAYSQYSQNSFVHSVVERDMPLWTVVDEDK